MVIIYAYEFRCIYKSNWAWCCSLMHQSVTRCSFLLSQTVQPNNSYSMSFYCSFWLAKIQISTLQVIPFQRWASSKHFFGATLTLAVFLVFFHFCVSNVIRITSWSANQNWNKTNCIEQDIISTGVLCFSLAVHVNCLTEMKTLSFLSWMCESPFRISSCVGGF